MKQSSLQTEVVEQARVTSIEYVEPVVFLMGRLVCSWGWLIEVIFAVVMGILVNPISFQPLEIIPIALEFAKPVAAKESAALVEPFSAIESVLRHEPAVVAEDVPQITWVGSPNFNDRPDPDDISLIVIHATAGKTLAGVVAWFNNPASRVSAHFTISKNGLIVQHVHEHDRAWHAGVSQWQDRPDVNNYSLGIELVNMNDGHDPYPEVQFQALVVLVTYLCRTYNIDPDHIVGHRDVAPKRKTDPRGFDLERLRREVQAKLGQ